MKKLIFVISFMVVSGFLFGLTAPEAKATTTAELQVLIQQLQEQIATLQQQLAEIQEEQPITWCHDFNISLKIGDSGSEVQALQTALSKEGFYQREINNQFDEYTASAVVGFQEKYASEVLAPWGLTHGTGYVGPTTRAKLNKLYGCKEKEVCVQKGSACCLGDVCNSVMITCEEGKKPVFKGCDASCNPQWECLSSTPFVTVISPNGGEKWEKGKKYEIKWDFANIPDSKTREVTIWLRDDSRQVGIGTWSLRVGTAKVGDKGYFWEITYPDIFPGDKYEISIEAPIWTDSAWRYSGEIWDQSDNYFSIVEPTQSSITVISPNGGETWTEENTYKIIWNQIGLDQVKINIELLAYKQDRTPIGKPYQVATNISAGQGYYSWRIPSKIHEQFGQPPDKYKVRLANYKSVIAVGDEMIDGDESDDYLSIISSTPACTDSDGGINHYVRGNCLGRPNIYTDQIKILTDYCITPRLDFDYNLIEYACGYVQNVLICVSYAYKCPYGCQDGACK